MTTPAPAAKPPTPPCLVGFVRCLDGKLQFHQSAASASEISSLRMLLDGLEQLGLIHGPVLMPAPPAGTAASLIQDLRQDLGEIAVDAVLDAGTQGIGRKEPPPATIAPVWPFEPAVDGDDGVLVSSLRLYGVDLKLEARRADPDATEHTTIVIPGHAGEYLVFAEPA